MAIKEPVKTVDEAFNNSCKRNSLSVRKRKKIRRSMNVRDEENNIYIVSSDLSIRKKLKGNSSRRKRNGVPVPKSARLKMPIAKVDVISTVTKTEIGRAGKQTEKELIKV